jgi:serine/threonine protein kinase
MGAKRECIFDGKKAEDLCFGDGLGEGKFKANYRTNVNCFPCLGAFGNVKVGWLKGQPNKKYAIKTMKKAEIINSKHVDHIENEKLILERIDHPFAVSLTLVVNQIML